MNQELYKLTYPAAFGFRETCITSLSPYRRPKDDLKRIDSMSHAFRQTNTMRKNNYNTMSKRDIQKNLLKSIMEADY